MQGADLRARVDRAKADEDPALTNQLLHQEWRNVAASYLKAQVDGYDPLRHVDPEARSVSPEVIIPFMSRELAHRENERKRIYGEDQGIQAARKLYDNWMSVFRTRNEGAMEAWNENLPPEELARIADQFNKVEMSEQDQQMMLSALNAYEMRVRQEADPNYDVMEDPDLGYMAQSISAASRPFGPGHFTVADPLAEGGSAAARTTREFGYSLGEGVGEMWGQVANGVNWLGLMFTGNLDSDFADAYRQQTESGLYMDRKGDLQMGKGRINAFSGPYQSLQLIKGRALDDIQKEVEAFKDARDWDRRNVDQEGMEYYANAIAWGAAGVGQFLGTGGAQMMTLGVRGATRLLGATGARLGRLNRVLAGIGGVTGGTTVHGMAVAGRIEGYGKAAIEGAKLGPIFWALGALGGRAEKFLSNRAKMPAFVKRSLYGLTGAAEGAMLTGSEYMLDKAWTFMRDPSEEHTRDWTRAAIANMFGFGILKATTGTTLSEQAQFRKAFGEENYQALLAREAEIGRIRTETEGAKTEEQVAALAAKESVSRETIREYGQALRDVVGAKGQEAAEIDAQMREIEERIGLEKAGHDMSPGQRERYDLELRDEIARMTEELPSAEAENEIRKLELIRESIRPEITEMRRAEDVIREVRETAPKEPSEGDMLRQVEGMEGGRVMPKEFRDRVAALPDSHLKRRIVTAMLEKARGLLTTRAAEALETEILQVAGSEHAAHLQLVEASRMVAEMRGAKLGPKPPSPPKPPKPGQPPKPPRPPKREAEVAEMREPPSPTPGKPKSLDITPQLEMEGVEGTPFMRRSDLELRMQGLEGDPIQVPIRRGVARKGKYSTAGLLGWYNRVENQVRLKDAEAILPMTHEFSHAFEQMAAERGMWDPKDVPTWMREALNEVASTYPGLEKLSAREQVAEGFAEFWARWMLDDPRLPTEVPELWEWMNNWISKPEMTDFRRQLGEVQLLHRQWRNLGAVRRMKAGVQRGQPRTPVERQARGGLWERLMRTATRSLFDDIIDIKEAQAEFWGKAGLKAGDVPISADPVRLIESLRMRAYHEAQQMINEGTHDLSGRRTGESMRDVLETIDPKDMDDFIAYIVSRRVVNLHERGVTETGFSVEDALHTIRVLEKPEFQRAAERIREYANRVLEYGVEAGSISEEAARRMTEAEPIYVPFQRILTLAGEAPVVRTGPSRGIAERAGGPKRIKGFGRGIRDPIAALGEATAAVVRKAQQHLVMKAMLLQSKLFPKLGGLVTEVPRDVEPREILVDRLNAELERIGKKRGREKEAARIAEEITQLMGGETEALTFFFQKAFPSGPRPILAFRPNFTEGELGRLGIERDTDLFESLMSQSGKTLWLEVDPRAYNTLMTIDGPQILGQDAGLLMRGLLLPARMVRLGATVLNPDFIVRNLIRDPFARQMFTQAGGKDLGIISGFGSLLAGLSERVRGTEDAKMFKALGLEGATLFGSEMARELQMREGGMGIFVGLAGAAKKVGELFSQPETWLRVDEFKKVRQRLIEDGASEFDATQEAALAAKEVTVNFTRRGAQAAAINQLIPYFSAGLAGLRKFWRAVGGAEGKAQQHRALIQGTLNIGGAAALFYLLHGDEEWYQELPLWRRVNYFNTKIGDEIVSFPKPFEAGIFFGSTTELMLMGVENKFDKKLAKEVAWEFAKQHLVGMPWIPSPVLPVGEQFANYSFFRKQEIVPGWMLRSRLPEDQYTAYTGEVYKWIGENLGVSPARIEYGFNSLFGGLPRQLTRAVETLTGASRHGELSDAPGLGVLFRQTVGKQARSVNELYEMNQLLEQKAGSEKITPLEETARPLISAALRDLTEIRKLQRTGSISREQSNLRQMRRARQALTQFQRITER